METTSAQIARLAAQIRAAQKELQDLSDRLSLDLSTDGSDHLNDGLSDLERALDGIEHAQYEFSEAYNGG